MAEHPITETITNNPIVNDFLDKFPEGMHSALRRKALVGQARLVKQFADYQKANEHALQHGQHPHRAAIGGTEPSGHERFTEGMDLVGETLVLRVPTLVDAQGELTLKTRAFLALVKMKGIPHIPASVCAQKELIDIVYDYYANDGKGISEDEVLLREYAKSRKGIYDTVRNNGFKHYEDLGLDFSGLDDAGKFKLALAVEESLTNKEKCDAYIKGLANEEVFQVALKNMVSQMREEGSKSADIEEAIRVAIENKNNAPSIEAIVQDEINGRQYLWNGTKFIAAATYNENKPEANKSEALNFFSKFESPRHDDDWQAEVAYPFLVGSTKYKKACAEWKTTIFKKFKDVLVSVCSDARTLVESILGPSKFRRRHVLRTPGPSLVDDNGNFNYDADMFFALAERRDRMRKEAKAKAKAEAKAKGETLREESEEKDTLFAGIEHSNCGANDAEFAYLSDRKNADKAVPKAFQILGDLCESLYQQVISHGSAQETIKYFKEKTGVPVKSYGDCLGIMSLMMSRRGAMARTYNNGKDSIFDPNVDLTIFHNTVEEPEPRLYVYSPKTNKLEPVPTITELQRKPERKAVLARLQVEGHHA